ncbi:helix-turn-helix domain-containing protein [Haemophilus influenzae]|uniref:helix-turn-helix domain-containing protein n=1 Tax=Haemophilus influenzae TaxID=727 RepID=UPI000D01E83B|nr:helix-turn-helix domain-containing protein [Haemophilus influenzae]PRM47625.1 HTH-type transcriptional regulator Xre [Haemophilus influenzae]
MKKLIDLNSYEIIERMKKICNVHTDKELADFVGVQSAAINKWRTRNSVSFEALFCISENFNVTIDWLLHGKEKSSELASDARMALLAFNDLDDRKKLEAIAFMTGLKTSSSQTGTITQHVSGSKNNVVGNGHIRIEKNDA